MNIFIVCLVSDIWIVVNNLKLYIEINKLNGFIQWSFSLFLSCFLFELYFLLCTSRYRIVWIGGAYSYHHHDWRWSKYEQNYISSHDPNWNTGMTVWSLPVGCGQLVIVTLIILIYAKKIIQQMNLFKNSICIHLLQLKLLPCTHCEKFLYTVRLR